MSAIPEFISAEVAALTDITLKYVPSVLGMYLHGSTCLGGFTEGRSDIDLLVISDAPMSMDERAAFADVILTLHGRPSHIELSVAMRRDLVPLPVKCQFHFSEYWAKRYAEHDPTNYLLGNDFTDDDLTSYIKLINQCGIVLFGAEPRELLPEIGDDEFFDAIAKEINEFGFGQYGDVESDIIILSRIESFAYTRRIMTKLQSAEWAVRQYPRFAALLEKAAKAYADRAHARYDHDELEEYKNFMTAEIKKGLR